MVYRISYTLSSDIFACVFPVEVRWLCPSHHQRLHRILSGHLGSTDAGKNAPTLHVIRIAFNGAELATLKKQANLEGVTVTAFIRQLVIKNTPVHLIELNKPPTSPDGAA
jgi:hypothetical protein